MGKDIDKGMVKELGPSRQSATGSLTIISDCIILTLISMEA